ncbi:hypothetical protein HN924_00770 [Candidatus Woesearchaeota archaeon]|jgi:hypothetical protein|nr:hypothetical protein [Candidatus Woesearchaeota archaeon]
MVNTLTYLTKYSLKDSNISSIENLMKKNGFSPKTPEVIKRDMFNTRDTFALDYILDVDNKLLENKDLWTELLFDFSNNRFNSYGSLLILSLDNASKGINIHLSGKNNVVAIYSSENSEVFNAESVFINVSSFYTDKPLTIIIGEDSRDIYLKMLPKEIRDDICGRATYAFEYAKEFLRLVKEKGIDI